MRKVGLIGLVLSLLPLAAHAQRVLIHPEKVEIKPPLVYRTDNALKVWGGISAGPDADDIVVFSDGTLNTSAAIADGSLTFAKWDDNGCASGEIPKWNGSAWACASDSTGTGGSLSLDDGSEGTPSLNFSSDTNTGMWRVGADTIGWSTGGDRKLTLDSAGRLGVGADSPAALLHIQSAASIANFRLTGGSNSWDIISDNSPDNFTIGDADSGTPVFQADADQVAIAGAVGSYTFEVNGTANVTGTIGFGNVRNSVVPNAGSLDLGSIGSNWRRLYANELVNVLFVEEVAQLFGGYQVVGKAVGSIAADVAPADITIDFGETITPPQWVLIRGKDLSGTAKTEYIRVVSLSSGTVYNVERDKTSLHGATPPNWGEGTPWLLLGGQGDGRIELYANSGIPRISFFTNELAASSGSNDPSDQLEWIRIGDLSNIQTTGTTPVSTYNSKVGFYVGSGSNSIIFAVNPSGSGAAMYFNGDGDGIINLDGAALQAGTVTAGKLETNLTISTTIQTAANCGTSGQCVKMNSSGIFGYDGTTAQFALNSSTGKATAAGGNIVLDSSGLGIALIPNASYANTGAVRWTGTAIGGDTALYAYEAGTPAFEKALVLANGTTNNTYNAKVWLIASHTNGGSRIAQFELDATSSTSTAYLQASTITITGAVTLQGVLSSSGDIEISPSDDLEFGGDDLIPTSGRASAAALGSTTRKWNTGYFDLDEATSDFVPVVTKSDGALYYATGLSATISVRKGDNSGACNITVVSGIITATTC